MVLACAIAAVEIALGLAVAFETDSPAGAVIVLGAAFVYLGAMLLRRPRAAARAAAGGRPLHVPAQPRGHAR
jgi:ABC-type Mn2+/Zn2+ transport system permease subunit